MKKNNLLLLFFFLPVVVCAQNLVPNPSFEDTHNVVTIGNCPSDIGETIVLNDWIYSSFSPDYFSRCDTVNDIASVPENIFGFQESNSNSYIGMYTYARGGSPNYREIIGAKLIDSLNIGNRYYVKMKVSHSNCLRCIANNIGLLSTTIPIQLQNPVSLPNHSQLHSLNIISDTLNWVELSGSFIADSNYKYVFVGNFYDDFNTDTLISSCSWCPLLFPDSNVFVGDTVFCTAYYYIDDIYLSKDSLENTIELNPQITTTVFPNPSNDFIYLNESDGEVVQFFLTNLLGQEITKGEFKNEASINVSSLPSGMYYLVIKKSNNEITAYKQLIIH